MSDISLRMEWLRNVAVLNDRQRRYLTDPAFHERVDLVARFLDNWPHRDGVDDDRVFYESAMDLVAALDSLPAAVNRSKPGYYPDEDGELGTWVFHVPGGSAYATNLAGTIALLAGERAPGPMRETLERLYEAIKAAMEP